MDFIEARHRPYSGDGQFVPGQRSSLVDTKNVHGRGFIHGRKTGQQDVAHGEGARREGGGQGEACRQSDRNGGQNGRQSERDNFHHRQMGRIGVAGLKENDKTIENRQIPHDAHNRLLLRAGDMRGAHEFRRMPKPGPAAGCDDFGEGLTPAHQRPGIGQGAWTSFDRQGFSGERRLIEQDIAFKQADIGADHAAQRQFHDVAGNQLGAGDRFPDAAAPNDGDKRQTCL